MIGQLALWEPPPPEPGLRIFSDGSGVQSVACLALAAMGELDYRTFVFANVGDLAESPHVFAYREEYLKPFARKHGIATVEVRKKRRDGTPDDLYETVLRQQRSIIIPIRMAGGCPGNRGCTPKFKVIPISRWTREQGATPARPAAVGIGFSYDERHRAKRRVPIPWEVPEYPLIERGLRRQELPAVIRRVGLPVPRRSRCWFCPMAREEEWLDLAKNDPETAREACEFEELLIARREGWGKDAAYLSGTGKPLRVLFTERVPGWPWPAAA